MPRRRAARALFATLVGLGVAVAVLPAAGANRPVAKPKAGTPSYTSYVAPSVLGRDAGEPSIGANWRTGAMLLQAGLTTAKLTLNGGTQWSNESGTTSALVSLDPIGFTDSAAGRTFVSQLLLIGSAMEFTDNDGQTWTASQGSGIPAGVDHQSVGGGPYPPESGAGPLTAYPHAVYYCSQDIVTAFCARSDTGGLTFGPGLPAYTLSQCAGLHGHVKVGPDGTVYLPNSGCGGGQGVAVSRDAGVTWTVRRIPGAKSGDSDPSVAIGKDGTVYFAYDEQDGTMRVAVSRDRGATWTTPVNVGKSAGIQSALFSSAVAGDGDRAAVAFLGTTTEGNDQNVDFGKDSSKTKYVGASYRLYVSHTYDRGLTWTTVDITGKDPVQRGRICMGGTTCSGGDRNLLDFMGITLDRDGRVLVGWPDGCTGGCVDSDLVAANTHTSAGVISRQSGGTLLYRSPAALAK